MVSKYVETVMVRNLMLRAISLADRKLRETEFRAAGDRLSLTKSRRTILVSSSVGRLVMGKAGRGSLRVSVE